jgi:predicted small lipoprotein YifL
MKHSLFVLMLVGLLVGLTGCDNDPLALPPCTTGSPLKGHQWSAWSESQYINKTGTNLFLGLPINTQRYQVKHCTNCNIEVTRLVN